MPISIQLGVLSWENRQKSVKIAKKTPYVKSRSFKVIEFAINRKGICNFLLVVIATSAVSRTVSELRRLIA